MTKNRLNSCLNTFSFPSDVCFFNFRYTGELFSVFKSEVAEKENNEGSSDKEVNTPVDGSNILSLIKWFLSLLHSSYVTVPSKYALWHWMIQFYTWHVYFVQTYFYNSLYNDSTCFFKRSKSFVMAWGTRKDRPFESL